MGLYQNAKGSHISQSSVLRTNKWTTFQRILVCQSRFSGEIHWQLTLKTHV